MRKIVTALLIAVTLASVPLLAQPPFTIFVNKLLVQDEGVNVLPQYWTLNFTGAGSSCSADNTNGRIVCDFYGGGGGGAPTDAQYWVGAANATLSAEKDLSGFTALVLNTAGTPSAYAGVSCTNQFIRSLTGSGAGTCATVVGGDFGSQTANFFFAAPNGAPGNPAFRAIVDADVPDTITLTNITQITNRAISDTTGTLAVARGGTNQTTSPEDNVLVGNGATWELKTIPDCDTAGTSKLLYDQTTNTWSCGVDQSGGGSSHDLLSATHTDTTAASVVRGDVIVGDSTPKWVRKAIGPFGQALFSDGVDVVWATVPFAQVKGTDQGTTSVTFVDITGLTMSMPVNSGWQFFCYIRFQSTATTNGFSFSTNMTGGTNMAADYMTRFQVVANGTSGADVFNERHDVTFDAMANLSATITANADLLAYMHGFAFGGTSGDSTFAPRFRSELNTQTVTVRSGTYCNYARLF